MIFFDFIFIRLYNYEDHWILFLIFVLKFQFLYDTDNELWTCWSDISNQYWPDHDLILQPIIGTTTIINNNHPCGIPASRNFLFAPFVLCFLFSYYWALSSWYCEIDGWYWAFARNLCIRPVTFISCDTSTLKEVFISHSDIVHWQKHII